MDNLLDVLNELKITTIIKTELEKAMDTLLGKEENVEEDKEKEN